MTMTMSHKLAQQLVARKLVYYIINEYDIGIGASSFESEDHSIPGSDIEEIVRIVEGIADALNPDDSDVAAAVALLEENGPLLPKPKPLYPNSVFPPDPFIDVDGRKMRWLHTDTAWG